MSGFARSGLTVLAGAAAGALASTLIAWPAPSMPVPMTVVASPQPRIDPYSSEPVGNLAGPRPAMLNSETRAPLDADGAPSTLERPTTIDPERRAAMFTAAVEAHKRDSIDPGWARSTSAFITARLEKLASGGISVSDVDCRMTSCTADITFAGGYDSAERLFHTVLEQPYNVPCAVTMHLSAPSDRSVPFNATALFECER